MDTIQVSTVLIVTELLRCLGHGSPPSTHSHKIGVSTTHPDESQSAPGYPRQPRDKQSEDSAIGILPWGIVGLRCARYNCW